MAWLFFGKHKLEKLKVFIPRFLRKPIARSVRKLNATERRQLLRDSDEFKRRLWTGLRGDMELAASRLRRCGVEVGYAERYD